MKPYTRGRGLPLKIGSKWQITHRCPSGPYRVPGFGAINRASDFDVCFAVNHSKVPLFLLPCFERPISPQTGLAARRLRQHQLKSPRVSFQALHLHSQLHQRAKRSKITPLTSLHIYRPSSNTAGTRREPAQREKTAGTWSRPKPWSWERGRIAYTDLVELPKPQAAEARGGLPARIWTRLQPASPAEQHKSRKHLSARPEPGAAPSLSAWSGVA